MDNIDNTNKADVKKGISVIKNNFWNINWIKTIYLNFKVLPFSKAVMLPLLVGKHVKLRSIGKIIIEDEITTGMISLGVVYCKGWEDPKDGYFILSNRGTMIFKGHVKFYTSVKLYVKGKMTFGGNNSIGARSMFFCYNEINLGYNSGCSWDCTYSDTNFHPLKDLVSDKFLKQDGKIVIEDNVFVGNHTCILINTKIPAGSVISSYSKVSGSFRKEGENLLISSNNSVVVGKGYQMYDFCQL